jgi:3-hydroxyisobutyrate dehydrogenase-like beta-hydroxyacid dehydrogenase
MEPRSASPSPLGIIGLGLLGSALAERAIAAGLPVVGFDIVAERRANLERRRGAAAAAARDVAARCRRLLLVLPHDGVSRAIVNEIADVLTPEHVVLDATTGDADATAALGERLAARGVAYLDAAVSGSSEQARRGEALLMVGGACDAFEACRELFDVLAKQAIYVGPCGNGAKMKLVTNLVLGLNRAALAEGLVLAAALGLDLVQSLAVLRASAAYSKAIDAKGEKMIRGEFAPQAKLAQHLKDVRLMLAAAERSGRRLPLSETHRALLEFAETLGLGELDNSAVIRAIEQIRSP